MDHASLNRNELETLRILWERGQLKPADIQADFSWPIENATLRSVLVNLVRKKQVTRELRGKAFFYAASVPKTTLLQGLMKHLAQVFAGGSHRELVAQLIETGDIEPSDLAVIRRVAEDTASQKTKRKSK
jgi:BlaI family transcriptional regulator, penicillinase repressor